MKIEKLQPGMVVYNTVRHRMGNTTLTTLSVYAVKVISVDVEKGTVVASWNHNPPQTFHASSWRKWTARRPELVPTGFAGQQRRKTKGEK
jgi:hypothetical protein